jgi:hypothetical protein
MGRIIDDITGFKDSLTGGAFEALTAADGESFSIRWLGPSTSVKLLEAWGGNNAHKCDFSIRSPLLHDNVRGIRFAHMFNPTESGADGNPQMYLPPYWRQPYEPTDTLIVEANGTASDDVTFSQSLLYETPEDIGGRFERAEVVEARLRNLVGIRVSPAAAASTSTFGASEAIDTDDNRLKANTDYALLGITSDLPFTTLGIYGPDTGNFTVSMPGHWDEKVSAGWFYEMARRWNEPLIPIINSNNKGVTYVKVADAGGGTAPLISLLFAELG